MSEIKILILGQLFGPLVLLTGACVVSAVMKKARWDTRRCTADPYDRRVSAANLLDRSH